MSTGLPKIDESPSPPHTMVCCWYSWTSNTWTPLVHQTQHCRAPLLCRTTKETTTTTTGQCPWDADRPQLKTGPHWCLPRSLQRNWMIPRYIPHHPPWEHHTCCPPPTQVPYHSTALGMGQTEWMGTGRKHHTCWRTNRLGIITSILNETKRKTTTLLESQRPQLGNQERPL